MAETKPEPTREEKLVQAKELYGKGSRNFLVKSYSEAADELSQVCALYEELHGELCDELGMPYLLYAKSLIALAMEESKVIDVPEEQEEDEDVDEEEESEAKEKATNGTSAKLDSISESKSEEADSTDGKPLDESKKEKAAEADDAAVSSTEDAKTNGSSAPEKKTENGTEAEGGDIASEEKKANGADSEADPDATIVDEEEGEVEGEEGDDIDAATNLQVAWETLELASKIFSRQGLNALPNLAEVQTELANIEFENNVLDDARNDYKKALQIYKDLPNTYRRATAEIHYKIGLTYLMQQMNDDGANELTEACNLIESEIEDIKTKKDELTEKEKNNIQDMEEIKQEIIAKVQEIKETKQQTMDKVRAALDNFMSPVAKPAEDGAGPSSSTLTSSSSSSSSTAVAASSSSKPTDISHLIKRKKPDSPTNSEAEAAASPAKRPAVAENA